MNHLDLLTAVHLVPGIATLHAYVHTHTHNLEYTEMWCLVTMAQVFLCFAFVSVLLTISLFVCGNMVFRRGTASEIDLPDDAWDYAHVAFVGSFFGMITFAGCMRVSATDNEISICTADCRGPCHMLRGFLHLVSPASIHRAPRGPG